MKKLILDTVSDLARDFVIYDRRKDEELSTEQLKQAISNGEVTITEICSEFKKSLIKALTT